MSNLVDVPLADKDRLLKIVLQVALESAQLLSNLFQEVVRLLPQSAHRREAIQSHLIVGQWQFFDQTLVKVFVGLLDFQDVVGGPGCASKALDVIGLVDEHPGVGEILGAGVAGDWA